MSIMPKLGDAVRRCVGGGGDSESDNIINKYTEKL